VEHSSINRQLLRRTINQEIIKEEVGRSWTTTVATTTTTAMKVKVVFSIVQGQSRRTHVARGGSNVQVTVLSDARYGSTTMKSCMGLICYSRPDLIPNQQTDYALSVLDVQETDGLAKSSTSTISEDDKVWEGKGMMSWLLTEKGLGAKVVGRMTGTAGSSDDSQVLEVILELMPVSV